MGKFVLSYAEQPHSFVSWGEILRNFLHSSGEHYYLLEPANNFSSYSVLKSNKGINLTQ